MHIKLPSYLPLEPNACACVYEPVHAHGLHMCTLANVDRPRVHLAMLSPWLTVKYGAL